MYVAVDWMMRSVFLSGVTQVNLTPAVDEWGREGGILAYKVDGTSA